MLERKREIINLKLILKALQPKKPLKLSTFCLLNLIKSVEKLFMDISLIKFKVDSPI